MLFLTLPGTAQIITEVRAELAQGQVAQADARMKAYQAQHGVTPEGLEALSWMARGTLALRQTDKAETYANETEKLVIEHLKKQALDSDPHLGLALGAAIEVKAQVLEGQGDRAGAIALLRKDLATYGTTSIRARIQKNLNLLTIEGKPAPALQETEYLGGKPVALATLKGKPVVLFFWAHWCGDCKAEAPLLAEVKREYASKGLVVIAPTQRYGYVARGEEAAPDQELKYIDEVRHRFYGELLDVPAPISDANLKRYGASTTPTLVFIDRNGIVRLYHPGAMRLDELRSAISAIAG